ncbi:unnamed protein product [Vicia faba]|uniref:Uncharacterized protein n=1 Tax=Vicia faba TaxID=3906 RepID=A0AAV0ZNY5_VICFA|nr:unnamed protein product [Vicia faba]
MQAQHTVMPDMNYKDKFLILSTVVPFGTTEDDITSDMFIKDSGKYIEENKLKVVLISPPSLLILIPVNVKGLEPVLDRRGDITDEDNVPRHAENEGEMKQAIDDDVQLNLAKGCEGRGRTWVRGMDRNLGICE